MQASKQSVSSSCCCARVCARVSRYSTSEHRTVSNQIHCWWQSDSRWIWLRLSAVKVIGPDSIHHHKWRWRVLEIQDSVNRLLVLFTVSTTADKCSELAQLELKIEQGLARTPSRFPKHRSLRITQNQSDAQRHSAPEPQWARATMRDTAQWLYNCESSNLGSLAYFTCLFFSLIALTWF